MAYIGAGITRFNTADDLTVTDDAEIKGELSVDGAVDLNTSLNVDGTVTADGLTVAASDVLVDLRSNNNLGSARNILRFTDIDATSTGGQGIGSIEFFSSDTDATVANILSQSTDASPGGRLVFRTAEATTLANRIQIDNNGDISFYEDTGTTPKLFWDASAESLGLGTTSPTVSLDVFGNIFANSSNSSNNSEKNGIYFGGSTGGSTTSSAMSAIQGYRANNFENGHLIFKTQQSGTLTEAMRIDSSGNLLLGTTSASGNSLIRAVGPSSAEFAFGNGVGPSTAFSAYLFNYSGGNGLAIETGATGAIAALQFYNPNGVVGSVVTSSSATAYNTSSDYRLKEDWVPMSDSIARVKALNPVNFAWKVDGTRVDGFLAHEAQEVVPEAVTGEKDAVDAEGNPEYQGIDQAKLVPLLTAALQEAIGRIETLEAEVAALKNG